MRASDRIDRNRLADIVAGATKVREVGQRVDWASLRWVANLGDEGIMEVHATGKSGLERSGARGWCPVSGESLACDISVTRRVDRDADATIVRRAAEIGGIDQSNGAGAVGIDLGCKGVERGLVHVAGGDRRSLIEATLLRVENREIGARQIGVDVGVRVENGIGRTRDVHIAAVIDGDASAGKSRRGGIHASEVGGVGHA